MSLIFYYAPMSTASTVHWTLEELGISYEKVKIDLKAHREKPSADLLRVNPNGKVPVLVHDGGPIFESAAIQIYLGETFGKAKQLFPAAGPERGEAMQWIIWPNVNLGEALSRFQRNVSAQIPEDQRNAKAGEVAKKELDHLLGIADGALSHRRFLLGEQFSIADIQMASWTHYLTMCGISVEGHPKLHAWMQTCIARPAYQKIMSET